MTFWVSRLPASHPSTPASSVQTTHCTVPRPCLWEAQNGTCTREPSGSLFNNASTTAETRFSPFSCDMIFLLSYSTSSTVTTPLCAAYLGYSTNYAFFYFRFCGRGPPRYYDRTRICARYQKHDVCFFSSHLTFCFFHVMSSCSLYEPVARFFSVLFRQRASLPPSASRLFLPASNRIHPRSLCV